MKPEILVVDDDTSHRQMLETVLSAAGFWLLFYSFKKRKTNEGEAS